VTDDLAERQARDTAALAREVVGLYGENYTDHNPAVAPQPCAWGDDAWHRAAKRLTRAVPYTWLLLLAEERAKSGEITREINANPEEVESLRRSVQQAQEGEVRWLADDESLDDVIGEQP
jgi:hypothetical protein